MVHVRTPSVANTRAITTVLMCLQARDGRHRKPLQPPTDRPRRRHDLHLAEAFEQRVILDEGEVPQPSAADDQQSNQQAHHRHGPEVAPRGRPGTGVADHTIEPRGPQVAPEQLEPRIRGQRHVREFQLQIPIDSGAQISSASSHVRWPFVDGLKGLVGTSLQPQRKAFFNFKLSTRPEFLSHQG